MCGSKLNLASRTGLITHCPYSTALNWFGSQPWLAKPAELMFTASSALACASPVVALKQQLDQSEKDVHTRTSHINIVRRICGVF